MATSAVRSGDYMTHNNSPRQTQLEQIAHKVRVLRKLTKDTGFITSRSVGALLGPLNSDELAIVAELSDPSTIETK
jgi:hypothetical protein